RRKITLLVELHTLEYSFLFSSLVLWCRNLKLREFGEVLLFFMPKTLATARVLNYEIASIVV
ncbi:hypothetical protein ACFQZT_25950, partial [Paenibacillus sp. GCM10027628]|uniref:hypothetical protein n=1 Tax=Paenibacillus sp. GCM10027628 TaxID=3273413 RepID=UPI00363CF77A